jgi:hypothetical protein
MPDLYKAKIGLLAKLLIHNLENDPAKKTVLNDLTTTDFPTIFQDIYKEKARRLVAEKTLQIRQRLHNNLSEYVQIMLYTNLRDNFTIITDINVKLDVVVEEMARVHNIAVIPPPPGALAALSPESAVIQGIGVGANLLKTGIPIATNAAMTAKSTVLAREINRVHVAALAPPAGGAPNSPKSAELQAKGICAYLIKTGVPNAMNPDMIAKLNVLAGEINRVHASALDAAVGGAPNSPKSAELQAKGICAYLIKTGVPNAMNPAMIAKLNVLAGEINRVHAAALDAAVGGGAHSRESAQLEAMNVGADLIKNGFPDNAGDAGINDMRAESNIVAARINSEYTAGKEIKTPPLFIDYYYQEFDVEAALVSIGNNLKSVSDTDKPIVGGASKKKSSLKKKKRRIIKSKKPKTKKTIKKK